MPGLVNGGMVNRGHSLVGGGLVRAAEAGGGNGLLTGVASCAEANASNWTERVQGVNASLFNGAAISGGALALVAASSMYASVPSVPSYQFAGDYTIMATFTLASHAQDDYKILFTKGGDDPDELEDWMLFLYRVDGDQPDPFTPLASIQHVSPLGAGWNGEQQYGARLNNLYVLFGYYNDTTDELTARLYSALDATAETSEINPYDHGSYHSGQPLYYGSFAGLYGFLDGSIIRAASWDHILPDAVMDAYWNSGVPLPYSSWTS